MKYLSWQKALLLYIVICTVILRIHICGNFWVTQYTVVQKKIVRGLYTVLSLLVDGIQLQFINASSPERQAFRRILYKEICRMSSPLEHGTYILNGNLEIGAHA